VSEFHRKKENKNYVNLYSLTFVLPLYPLPITTLSLALPLSLSLPLSAAPSERSLRHNWGSIWLCNTLNYYILRRNVVNVGTQLIRILENTTNVIVELLSEFNKHGFVEF
jgi:hypothetical protein